MMRDHLPRQFGLFLLVGGTAAVVNWISRILLNAVVNYGVALVLAYGCGMICAYLLNRRYVFPGATRPVHQQVHYFIVVNLVAFPLVWGTSWLLSEIVFPRLQWTTHPREIAHGLALALPTVTSYFGHKYFTFSRA
jgi:putative flippase GtrA